MRWVFLEPQQLACLRWMLRQYYVACLARIIGGDESVDSRTAGACGVSDEYRAVDAAMERAASARAADGRIMLGLLPKSFKLLRGIAAKRYVTGDAAAAATVAEHQPAIAAALDRARDLPEAETLTSVHALSDWVN